jgi:hypothetical protein
LETVEKEEDKTDKGYMAWARLATIEDENSNKNNYAVVGEVR